MPHKGIQKPLWNVEIAWGWMENELEAADREDERLKMISFASGSRSTSISGFLTKLARFHARYGITLLLVFTTF